MIHARSLIALVATAAFASIASAQSPAPTRADVKADAKTAVKTGQTAEGELPKGAASVPKSDIVSTKSRPEVKDEAKAAVKSGDVVKGEGDASYTGSPGSSRVTKGGASGKSRAEVKADRASSTGSAPAGSSQTLNTERTVPPAVTSPSANPTAK